MNEIVKSEASDALTAGRAQFSTPGVLDFITAVHMRRLNPAGPERTLSLRSRGCINCPGHNQDLKSGPLTPKSMPNLWNLEQVTSAL